MNSEDVTSREIAAGLFKHEQTRWHAWTLFYLGLIAGVLYGRFALFGDGGPNEGDPVAKLSWMCWALAAVLSYLWCLTIVALRASTHAWRRVLLSFEKRNSRKALKIFKRVERFFRWYGSSKDLRWFFCFWRGPPSVTRLLGFLATIMTAVFGGMAWSEGTGDISAGTWIAGALVTLCLVAVLSIAAPAWRWTTKLGSARASGIDILVKWRGSAFLVKMRRYASKIRIRVQLRASKTGARR